MSTRMGSVEVQTGEAGRVTVSILGEVDMSRFEELDAILESAQADPPSVIEVDLSSVIFMDSQGIRLLLRARDRAKAAGTSLRIVRLSGFVRRLFEICDVDGMFADEGGTEIERPPRSTLVRDGEPRRTA